MGCYSVNNAGIVAIANSLHIGKKIDLMISVFKYTNL
jgi:hypothetical protein